MSVTAVDGKNPRSPEKGHRQFGVFRSLLGAFLEQALTISVEVLHKCLAILAFARREIHGLPESVFRSSPVRSRGGFFFVPSHDVFLVLYL